MQEEKLGKRPKEIVSYNMSKIRSQGTQLEAKVEEILKSIKREYAKYPKMFGKPDFAYIDAKVAIFADSDFWHGFDWDNKKLEIKTNKEFWVNKIERNIERDKEVTTTLEKEGWKVVRLWGHDIINNPEKCRNIIENILKES
jgi:DNA mismatch endonuclease (patch repair protein)